MRLHKRHSETVDDNDGSDLVQLGGGNDLYVAYDGNLADGLDTAMATAASRRSPCSPASQAS